MTFFFEVLILGLVLSADSFSAAVAMGSRRFSRIDLLKFAFASSTAEIGATAAGYFAGARLIAAIEAYDHWVAFGLLMAIALHLLWEGISDLRDPLIDNGANGEAEHSFLRILLVSVATSLDAFGVGIGLGIAEKPLLPFTISIGGWAFATTILGVYIGNRASKKLGPIFTIIAGLVLGVLSIKMLSI